MGGLLKKISYIALLLFVLLAAASLAGCGGVSENESASEAKQSGSAAADKGGGAANTAKSAESAHSGMETGTKEDRKPPSGSGSLAEPGGISGGALNQGVQDNRQQIRPGQLTAGEWSDLDNWDWWQNLMNDKEWSRFQNHWGFTPNQRLTVTVKSGETPVRDAKVVLQNGKGQAIWRARTNNKGDAELFVDVFGKNQTGRYQIAVEAGQEKKTLENVELSYRTALTVNMSAKPEHSNILDLMFVVDTTGSMADELEYLEAELANVIGRIKNSGGEQLRIRISTNFYRDHGDEYVVRSFPFTEDVDQAVKQISKQTAAGGGDYEEAVEEALEDAVVGHDWSMHAAARLLFLVLDAPPHHNGKIVGKLQELAAKAAESGIRIIPVASSGVNKDTEFLLRFLDIVTGGTYVFLTNHSGIGNDHIVPTIGQYKVEFLNELLVRVAGRYLK